MENPCFWHLSVKIHKFVSSDLTPKKTDFLHQKPCMPKSTYSYCISVLIGIFFFAHTELRAQNDLGSENALKKEAQKAFDDEDYASALKFYNRLLSANIKDPLYNYRYGVCLLNASPDKEEAVKFLEKASKDASLEKEVFYYYGKALQLNYRFNDAITAYTKYKSQVSESKAKKMGVDHLIETCGNGKNLLRHITDLQVVDKKELEDKDFFLSYDLSDIGGRLLAKPDEFKTALDRKKKENSIIFVSPDKSEIYFSSYGSSDENGKDIYVISRLANGEYGKPVSLGYPINTEYDEDYPFLHPNGKVLYFASKGHNSMGGYDIFKSERNEETGVWGKPVNLDFAINTPDDDILFVTDRDEKTAFFASRRGTEQGKIDVYHINLQRKPVDICIFKGKYIPKKEGESKVAKISVKNVDINEVEGVFKSAESDGEYVLNLPNGGKFLITVETQDGDIQSDMLVIPQQFETVPIRQEITYNASENGKMHLQSFFGASNTDDDKYSLAVDFIKERSKLDVNVSKDSKDIAPVVTDKTDTVKTADTTALAVNPHKNLSNDDLIHIAEQDSKELEKEANDARSAADKALVIVNEKNQKAQEINKSVEEANASAAGATTPEQKQIAESRADALQMQANTAESEASSANNFYKNLDSDANKKQKEADLSRQYAQDLTAAIKSKSKDAMAKLDAQKEALDKLNEEKTGADDMVASIQKDADAKHKEVEAAHKESSKIKDDIKGIEAEIVNLNREAAETKNDQLKSGISSQVEELKTEIKTKEGDLTVNDAKLSKLQKQAEDLNNEAYLVYQMNEKIKSGQITASSEPIDKDKLNEQISAYHPKELKHPSSYESPATVTDTTNNPNGQGGVAIKQPVPNKDLVVTVPVKEKTVNSEEKLINEKYAAVLASSDAKTTELEKEQAKTDALKQWSDALNIPIEDKKEELAKTQDQATRDKLSDEIGKLEKQKQEKQTLAKESQTRVDKLKSAEPVVSSVVKEKNADTSLHQTHTPPDVSPVKSDVASIQTPSSIQTAVDTKFSGQTAALDTITRPADKETAKAEVYNKWATTIETDIEGKKKELGVTGDKDQQSKLSKEIDDLEKDAADKRGLEKKSLAAAEQLKKTESSTPAVVTTQPDYENTYSAQLAASDKEVKPGASNDSSKAVLYTKWADALSNDIDSRKKNLQNISDKAKRNSEEQTISDLQTELAGKQAVARKLAERSSKDKTIASVPAKEKEAPAVATVNSTSESTNYSPERQKLDSESKQLKVKADSVYASAMKLQGDERAAKLKESNELEKDSRNKKSEAVTVTAKANEKEYTLNSQKMVRYASQAGAADKPELTQANTLNTESKNEFEKAKKMREAAAANDSYYAKQEALKGAEENERSAISKQNQSLILFAAAYPDVKTAEPAVVADNDPVIKVPDNPTFEHIRTPDTDTAKTSTAIVVSHAPVTDTNAITPVHTDTVSSPSATVKSSGELAALDAETRKSAAYKNYTRLKVELDIEQALVRADNKNADAFQMKAQANMRESDDLMKSSEAMTDSVTKKDAVLKAKKYEDLAARDFTKADSTRAHGRKLNEAAIAKRNEYNAMLDGMDPATRASVIALADKDSNPDSVAGDSNAVASVAVKPKKIVKTTTPAPIKPAKTPKDSTLATSQPVITPKDANRLAVKPVKAPKDSNPVVVKPLKNPKDSNPVAAKTTKPDKTIKPAKTTTADQPDPATTKEKSGLSANSEVFAINASAPATKVIPIDKELPQGLVFKVQIGAFRNPISPAIFKGMNPLTGETTPQGYIRFTAGLFSRFESAEKAKNDIHALGFKDAFVVAFFNGKRISVNEAMSMDKTSSASVPEIASGNNPAGFPNREPKKKNAADASPGIVNTNTPDSTKKVSDLEPAKVNNALPVISHDAPSAIAKTSDVTAISGLFYTVQVGVYSNAVSNEKLFGIQPLNTEKMPNGNLRYTSGQYTDIAKATEARNKIVETGVKDAFVVAYYNGHRLSLDDVKKGNLSASQLPANPANENAVKAPEPTKEKQPKEKNGTNNAVPSGNVVSAGNTPDYSSFDKRPIENVKADTGVVFKVQIGAFKEQVPIEIANKFLLFARRGVSSYKDENGNTVFTIGHVKNYADAQFLKEEAVAKGIPDAFILSFKDGKKIPVSDARGGQ